MFLSRDIGSKRQTKSTSIKYMEFLEEHEVVEDQMLFPLVKALFPQVRRVTIQAVRFRL